MGERFSQQRKAQTLRPAWLYYEGEPTTDTPPVDKAKAKAKRKAQKKARKASR